MSRVYFIKPIGLDGPIKIGCSRSVHARLEALATWSPWPLEVIAAVPGTLADEGFLHGCFAADHSHHEWFRSSPALRQMITKIAAAGSVQPARDELARIGTIRSGHRRNMTAEQRLSLSYRLRVSFAMKKLDHDGAAYWNAPDDVENILERWAGSKHFGIVPISPTPAEITRLDQFLADPRPQSTRHPRFKVVA